MLLLQIPSDGYPFHRHFPALSGLGRQTSAREGARGTRRRPFQRT